MNTLNRFKNLLGVISVALVICACGTSVKIEADYKMILPLPHEIETMDGKPFIIKETVFIGYPEGNVLLEQNAGFLADYIRESTGKQLAIKPISSGSYKNAIILGLDSTINNKEGYELRVSKENVSIHGRTANGVFYGIQALRKAIPALAKKVDIVLPAIVIKDEPRFGYRGMMLDVGRYFFPVNFIKKYIDLLALHNMNYFHWHLTEDQGWRIEIKKYPKLTEIGSIRRETAIGRSQTEFDGVPYGGFYTQEEIKEIVKYAQDRYITVIPEIDLPGHMLAALASYPELGCVGTSYEVARHWGVFPDVLCVGNEKTYEFLENVFTEIMMLFPAKYIHIGGDEAPRTRWDTCSKCQALAKREGLKADAIHTAEDRLQSYCMKRMERFLNEHGRQIIGWDEILEGEVAPNATVMSWRGTKGGIEAARMKHDVIMTPNNYLYFDYYQSDDKMQEPLAMGDGVTVEKVYGYEPLPEDLSIEEQKHIIGVQANVWTEFIKSPEHVEYMMVPRMAALAEVQWMSPEDKNYQDFLIRLRRLACFYQRDSINYAKHVLPVSIK